MHSKLAVFQAILVEFMENQPKLNTLNSMGYRHSLDAENTRRLTDLNTTWSHMSSRLSEKYRRLQAILLQQQNFRQKCEAWSTFLTNAEADLAVDIAGSYEGLLEQQKVYDVSILPSMTLTNFQTVLFCEDIKSV